MKDLPVRKNIRLNHYDYSRAGCYFITMCVKDRHEMLRKIVMDTEPPVGANCVRPQLSKYGNIVEKEISVLSETYDTVDVIKYVIMPNHVHMIIEIDGDYGIGVGDGRAQCAPTIPRIIKQFKGSITKQIGFSLWQKSFHDHIIRNEAEYQNIWRYIDENPARWEEDEYYK